MKLHQLRYLAAIAQTGLNITAAAEKLHTSQPGVSKQIKLLEDELGFQIFVRDGRNLARVTPAGQQVIDRATRILREVRNIKHLSEELKDESRGTLSIATTHTQARYVLPEVIKQFRDKYPDVGLHLHQGTSEQIGEMAALDRIDFAIATGSQSLFEGYSLLPCYRWHRHVVVPKGHPFAQVQEAHAQAARGAADRDLRVRLHGAVLAAADLRRPGAGAERRADRARCGRDQDLRAARARRRHRRQHGDRRQRRRTSSRSTPRISFPRTSPGSASGAAGCCGNTSSTSCSSSRRT